MTRKSNNWKLWSSFSLAVGFWCFALIGSANAQGVTLGPAADFALLSDAGPLTLANHTVMTGVGTNVGATYSNVVVGGNNSVIRGEVIATLFEKGPGATIGLTARAFVLGACVTDGGAITTGTGAVCLSKDTTGTNPALTMIGNAVNQEENFDAAVSCLAPTQSLAAINLADSATKTITDTILNGLNVISTPSITLGNSSVLTLTGGILDTVVLETPGALSVGDSAKIVLAGGLLPQNVWITSTTEPEGFNPPAAIPSVHLNNSSVVFGSIHGGHTCGIGTGVTITGAMICDYGISAGDNLTVHFAPATGFSLPGCSA